MGHAATEELISCLMVSRPVPERWEGLRRSVACFQAQTYPRRELVAVLDQGPAEQVERVKEYLRGVPGVAAVVQPPGPLTLGALRNVSVAAACGAVLCQWDDDDLSHPTRLAEQHRLLHDEGALAVALQDVLHFFPHARQLYWANFLKALDRCHPGTVMFRREARTRYPEDGPESRVEEDCAMRRGLEAEGKLVRLTGAPHLYVYVYHGANTWHAQHHRDILRLLALTRGLLLRRRAVFDQLGCFDLGEGLIDVMGLNGLAFRIPGRQATAEAGRGDGLAPAGGPPALQGG